QWLKPSPSFTLVRFGPETSAQAKERNDENTVRSKGGIPTLPAAPTETYDFCIERKPPTSTIAEYETKSDLMTASTEGRESDVFIVPLMHFKAKYEDVGGTKGPRLLPWKGKV